jgi:two-component system, chemotaxis family, protein-glutamate methylesterase/glutaminase
MPNYFLVVIGASAGGVRALQTLVGGLPADFPAPILIVMHTAPDFKSQLPLILNWLQTLPAAHAQDGELLLPGRIYIAPPDRHLLVNGGAVRLSHGPKENHSRPAIDPLFRSAVRTYGARTIGVILTGALDDGSRGLAQIVAAGGTTIVQNPDDAEVPSMPRAALRTCRTAHVRNVADIAPLLTQLVSRSARTKKGAEIMSVDPEMPSNMIQEDLDAQSRNELPPSGHSSVYVCPDCGGVLWQTGNGELLHFQCHTGHAYSPQTLLYQKSQMLEMTLWAAVRLLKEKQVLTRQISAAFVDDAHTEERREIEEMAHMDDENLNAIRTMLEAYPSPVGQGYAVGQMLDELDERRTATE